MATRTAKAAGPATTKAPLDTRIDHACDRAAVNANAFMLPQTVYRNADSAGWASTNPFSGLLHKAEVWVTMLPARYFT